MKEETLGLSATEKLLLERSSDLSITRRRVRYVVVSALVLAAALVVVSPLLQSWVFLLFFGVAYVLVTAWERVAWARTIIAYKGLIQKLASRIEQLETAGASHR